MVKHSLLYIPVIFFLACKPVKNESARIEIQIINDCFLDIVGTLGYQYHSLRPASQDSVFENPDSLAIGIYPQLQAITQWKQSIMLALFDNPDKDSVKIKCQNLFEKGFRDSTSMGFDISHITKRGRYVLFPDLERKYKGKSKIGNIAFSRVSYDTANKVGFLVAEIRDNIKVGIIKLVLLQEKNGLWSKVHEDMIEIW